MQRFPFLVIPRPTGFGLPAAMAALVLLAGCGGGGESGGDDGGGAGPADQDARIYEADPMVATNWTYEASRGVPPPRQDPPNWVIDLPYPSNVAGSLHYVTMQTGPLAGKTKITMRYRVEAEPGVKILPRRFPDAPSILTLYFQRNGDSWTAKGDHEAYRWYASFARRSPIAASGEEVIEARLDQNWTAVLRSSRANNPAGFRAALADTGRIGFVLGGGDGLGHGIYATGPARIVVTSFKVE